jgi:hypothetical protein
MRTFLFITVTITSLVAACDGRIYLRDGVTDGDTFFLAERAMIDPDAALQSWVSYSLLRSTCQLQGDSGNPARANSFDCELGARQILLETWSEKKAANPMIADTYLDELLLVQYAGYLPEYVARYLGQPRWQLPDDLKPRQFREWQRATLPGHRAETILTGSWGYRRR